MGILLPCRLPCDESSSSDKESSHSETPASLSSQPSLPSVPSLQLHQHTSANPNLNDVDVTVSAVAVAAHSSYISSLALAGKFLFSASSDGTVRLWPRRHHHHYHRPHAPYSGNGDHNAVVVSNSAIKSVVVSGDKLFTAHQDHKIGVWKIDAYSGSDDDDSKNHYNPNRIFKCVATLPTLKDRFSRLFLAKNYVTVRRHVKRTWVHHNDAVSALAVSKDGSTLYSASWDRTFKVWRLSDFKCLESVANAHDDAVNAIALADNGHVYTGSADRRIKVWKRMNKDNGGQNGHFLVETLEKHRSAVNALATSEDGMILYSGACDRSILVWERENRGDGSGGGDAKMIVVGALRGHSKAILSLAVVGDLVCSGSADCSVRVWKRSSLGFDKPTYACLAVLEGHRKPVKCLSLAVDNSNISNSDGSGSGECSYLVYSGGLDCEIKVWKMRVPS